MSDPVAESSLNGERHVLDGPTHYIHVDVAGATYKLTFWARKKSMLNNDATVKVVCPVRPDRWIDWWRLTDLT